MNMSNSNDELRLREDSEYEAEIDRMYFESLQEGKEYTKSSKIPLSVERFVTNAVNQSINNEVPAMLAYYMLLGQICKDMVCIPARTRRIDTRLLVIWMQTSGSGKTEMFNFIGPVADRLFSTLNERYGTDILDLERTFGTLGQHNRAGVGYDVQKIGDSTEAALVGSPSETKEIVVDEETGEDREIDVPTQIYGQLEGEGLMVFDEFHDTGVFRQTQHKGQIIYYCNTLMNTLWGDNWPINKGLLKGNVTCNSRRSMWATTYIPKTLASVITETGLMQRSIIYIREVPIEEQNDIRVKIASDYGVIEDSNSPIESDADTMIKIYETLREHYLEVNDPLRTVTFGKGFSDAVINETWKFQEFVQTSRPRVMEIANNFITRMQGMMVKLAVLSCIAESGTTIKKKENRFIVTERHVRQGAYITRQCYKSLVSWLDLALKADHKSIQDRAMIGEFKSAYETLIKTPNARTIEGEKWLNKTQLITHIMQEHRRGQAQVYRNYKKIKAENFDERREGRYGYVKMKRKDEQ